MGITKTKLISVKVPMKIFCALPAAHKGRSRFILSALEEKIRRQESILQPTTERDRRLKAILDKGRADRELQERRGRFH